MKWEEVDDKQVLFLTSAAVVVAGRTWNREKGSILLLDWCWCCFFVCTDQNLRLKIKIYHSVYGNGSARVS